jgi:type IV secretion system protein VirB8
MIRRIKQNTPQIENAIAKAVNFEIQIADIVERDQRRSWVVAYMSIFLTSVMALSYALIFPLHKIERYVVMIDPYLNIGRVALIDDDKAFFKIVSREAVLKRSVTNYVRAREGFDFPAKAYNDHPIVEAMSSPDAMVSYNELNAADNRKGPMKEFGRERAVRINFTKTELRRLGAPEEMRTEAVVRFQRFVYVKNGGMTTYKDSKIATFEFTFDRGLLEYPETMALNPLGFYVLSYRVDNDNAAPPPPPDYVPKPGVQSGPPQLPPPSTQASVGVQAGSPPVPGQGQQIPQFGAPSTGIAPNAQPQLQNPAQPAVQPQSAPPAGQAPNQVNGVRN